MERPAKLAVVLNVFLFLHLVVAAHSLNSTDNWDGNRHTIVTSLQRTSFYAVLNKLIEQPPELRHSEEDIRKTRKLLQTTGQLPICEMNIIYSITATAADGFSTSIALANNRELGSNWQLVYRYVDYTKVKLAYATGATALALGSTGGAPVRLVDPYALDASGIPAGGNYTFGLRINLVYPPATGFESLSIQNVNLNGLQCSQVAPASGENLQYSSCSAALSVYSTFSGGSGSFKIANEACSAAYCCGYILKDPSVVPSPPPSTALPPVLEPVPSPSPPLSNGDGGSDDTTPSPGPSPFPPPPPPIDDATNSIKKNPDNKGNNINSPDTVVLGAGVGAAVALAAAVLITGIWIRKRRRRRLRQIQDQAAKTSPLAATQNSNKNALNNEMGGRQGSLTAINLASAMTPVTQRSSFTMQRVTSGALSPSSGGTVSAATLGISSGSGNSTSTSTSGGLLTALPQEVTLFEQLGAGAFGTVYKGEWSGKSVAVKVLRTACNNSSKELNSFRQEVAVLSRLRHPNIISFLAACTVPPDICIIEELAEGGSLHTKLHGPRGRRRCCPLPCGQLLAIATDIAEAMVYLHPKIVHRDLKSQNVLLDATGKAKVCDFGIAKFKDRTFVSTVNGQAAGTPSYMAPELFDGAQATEKVDVYSFSILLWEMLTGQLPWATVPSPLQIIYYVGVLGQRPTLPSECLEPLKALIQACWSEKASDRPQFKEILVKLKEMKEEAEQKGILNVAMAPPSTPQGFTTTEGSEGQSKNGGSSGNLSSFGSGPIPHSYS